MLFTLIVSALFLFLTLTIGNWISSLTNPAFGIAKPSIFQNFLLGFASISCYLNIWSLFLPANYYALVPVLILSIFTYKYSSGTVRKIKEFFTTILRDRFFIVTVPIILVILAYSLLPPQHGDSPGYHFLTIRWNETYKAIPGLANLHGRFGFNSSFFVASAAFAFSDIAGQSLYVLNIVFVFCYYLWLVNKMYRYRKDLWCVVFLFVALAMFRQLLDSTSSPTPDILSSIIVSYVFITIIEKIFISEDIEYRESIILILLIIFAFTVKLSTFPLSFLALFLFVHNHLFKTRKAILIVLGIGSIIVVPWMIRNFILTGYLVFPVSVTGFLPADWRVPYQILHFEKLLINNGPKMISSSWEAVDALSFSQWFPLWIKAHFSNGLTFSLVILGVTVASAVAGLFIIPVKRYPSLFWLALINLISVVFWIYNSPDYRFGYSYLINMILILAFFMTHEMPLRPRHKVVSVSLVIILCAYYFKNATTMLFTYPIRDYAIKPLSKPQYDQHNDLSPFPVIMLNNQVKLYVEDSIHWCNMAPLPCCTPQFYQSLHSQIQLRGNSIEDGFRIVKK